MGLLPVNFQLPTPFCSRLRVRQGTDRQTDRPTDDGCQCIIPPPYGGGAWKNGYRIFSYRSCSYIFYIAVSSLTTVCLKTGPLRYSAVTSPKHTGYQWFLPRDAMRKRGQYSRPVSALISSVRLPVTLVYCIHTAEDIVKLLSRPSSPIILVFWPLAPVPNTKGTPQRGRKMHGICDFRLTSPFISETVWERQIGPWLL